MTPKQLDNNKFLTGEQVEKLLKGIKVYSKEEIKTMLAVRKLSLYRRTVNFLKVLADEMEEASKFYYEQGLNKPDYMI